MISTHTLTWSVTISAKLGGNKLDDFNSHAHVERDGNLNTLFFKQGISTHTLTWSVTICLKSQKIIIHISTHTLTWSVTADPKSNSRSYGYFNSHAHVERDHKLIDPH